MHAEGPTALLVACLLAPVCEEVLFRDAVPRLLSAVVHVRVALVLSAAAFAAIHIDLYWTAWIALFLGGLLLSTAYAVSENLLVPILAHILLNTALTVYSAFD